MLGFTYIGIPLEITPKGVPCRDVQWCQRGTAQVSNQGSPWGYTHDSDSKGVPQALSNKNIPSVISSLYVQYTLRHTLALHTCCSEGTTSACVSDTFSLINNNYTSLGLWPSFEDFAQINVCHDIRTHSRSGFPKCAWGLRKEQRGKACAVSFCT